MVWQGGAGTWSDGKLVTRIGRNSGSVLAVSFTSELNMNISLIIYKEIYPHDQGERNFGIKSIGLGRIQMVTMK